MNVTKPGCPIQRSSTRMRSQLLKHVHKLGMYVRTTKSQLLTLSAG